MINVVFVICAHIFVLFSLSCSRIVQTEQYRATVSLSLFFSVFVYLDLFLYLRYLNGLYEHVSERMNESLCMCESISHRYFRMSFHKFNYCGFRKIHMWTIEFYFMSTITVEWLEYIHRFYSMFCNAHKHTSTIQLVQRSERTLWHFIII